MRLVLSVFAVAAVLSACAKDPDNQENGTGGKVTSTGGTVGTGGKIVSTGGAVGSGGKVGTGGTSSAGGSSQPPNSVACNDVASMVATVTDPFGSSTVVLDSNSSKSYYFMANWWGKASGGSTPTPTEAISGLGFTVNNTKNESSADNNPMGFPTLFIGAYQGKPGKGSNLPKQVSALTSVPTIFKTNSSSLDTSNLNATYDVWFTTNGTVSGTSPGTGGAYLMVWLFKPSKRQPRGSIARSGQTIDNVPGVWNVWYDNTNPPCVSYVAVQPVDELQFDLNDFIKDSVANKWGVTTSQSLTVVFAGTEVWGGGNGFQVKQFCVDVK